MLISKNICCFPRGGQELIFSWVKRLINYLIYLNVILRKIEKSGLLAPEREKKFLNIKEIKENKETQEFMRFGL
jgi:hypothetical protein